MPGKLFTSESATKTIDASANITAGPNAAVAAYRGTGSGRAGDIKLGNKATLVINNGVGAEELRAGLDDLASYTQASNLHTQRTVSDALQSALAERVTDQVEAGGDAAVEEAKPGLGKSNYILIAFGAFLLIATALWLKNK